MGNNHNQYFSKDKRKIIIVGLEGSGKTSKHILLSSPSKLHSNRKLKPKHSKNQKS